MARYPQGPQAERDAVKLLREAGFTKADREYGAGRAEDVGDIRNVPRTTIEVKAEKAFNPSGWLRKQRPSVSMPEMIMPL